ncbi:thioredoxin family protein [Paenibacillus bouchesdurhonensis]|uniref:thioredoxin family protein n=1 Tax=Paenibacillus bouchesdurhonensis TaxID=1870990 RepID=UPI000DA6208A|nr:thioredoxin family protein [Paenibacillus bouchesdurhonensis]
MTIREAVENEFMDASIARIGREALYLYTPLCGTCKLGETMLGIVLQSASTIPVSKLNINFAPQLRNDWQITSVPCLVLLEHGKPVAKEYALRSVVDLHQWLKV